MPGHSHRWTGIGIAALLASTSTLAACGQNEADEAAQSASAQSGPLAGIEGGEGEGGEGAARGVEGGEGESGSTGGEGEGGEGEGGVAITKAASDPVVYRAALAIAKAHVIAARDAHKGGETETAGEMFSHPAGEVLFEMEPIFIARGVTPFADAFLDASDAVFSGASSDEVAATARDIIKTIEDAAKRAPDDARSEGQIAAGVIADQIERAADMYAAAKEKEAEFAYGPYLDGYGFYKAAVAEYEASKAEVENYSASVNATIMQAFAKLEKAYPKATLPGALDEDVGPIRAMVSQLILQLS